MKINIYRLRAWARNKKFKLEFDYEFKDTQYSAMKAELEHEGYRVQELFAWN